jgi:hypothetical protein
MMKTLALAMLAMAALPAPAARADGDAERPVIHAPFEPQVPTRVRAFVQDLAASFGGFYPQAQYRTVRAVYFTSGAIIVCGELNRQDEVGRRLGWRYFSNSGPLIFEGEGPEPLCDARTYEQPAFADDYDYAAEFIRAAAH